MLLCDLREPTLGVRRPPTAATWCLRVLTVPARSGRSTVHHEAVLGGLNSRHVRNLRFKSPTRGPPARAAPESLMMSVCVWRRLGGWPSGRRARTSRAGLGRAHAVLAGGLDDGDGNIEHACSGRSTPRAFTATSTGIA
jgi:hypothetical protein